MGKKKQNKTKPEVDDGTKPKESKGPRKYKGSDVVKPDDEGIQKVTFPAHREKQVLDLILDFRKKQSLKRSISQRLTSKKLTDLYNALNDAGFKQLQIENAMSSVLQYGGDLIDTLDWLCLNLSNEELPGGFSHTLLQEENKTRPKFSMHVKQLATSETDTVKCSADSVKVENLKATAQLDDPSKEEDGIKKWILNYADHSSDESDKDEEEADPDTNESYLALAAKLLDAKEDAAAAKEAGNKSQQKQIGQNIRTIVQEMKKLESYPDFNPQIRLHDLQENRSCEAKTVKNEEDKMAAEAADDVGFSIFEEPEEEVPKTTNPKTMKSKKVNFEKRDFSYTRQQWTGKSPKQFLIDWVRKHLPKSPPPSFTKVASGSNLWRAKCKVQRKDGDLNVCPEKIVCENVKDAEHLAATLALYELCKGQRVYMLLPPVYRDCWLEWQDEENQKASAAKEKENKPRDTYITKLMKQLKMIDNDKGKIEKKPEKDQTEDVCETWEDIDSGNEWDDSSDEGDSDVKKKGTLLDRVTPNYLKTLFEENHKTPQYDTLLKVRTQLPVYSYRDAIIAAVQQNQVLVIAGETGSGKSTQIPHFVLENCILSCNPNANIVCTEPRRISAISLAQRVCEELGGPQPGASDSLCGYQIRFETKRSDTTRLLYCTTGVLLRKLQLDPLLSDISHVIVDEVHERSVQSDFLLVILKSILLKRKDFKIVLMSATVDSEKFSSYFQHCPVFNIPGKMFPVNSVYIEDIIELTDYKLEDDSPYAVRKDHLVEEEKTQVNVSGKGGQVHTMELSWSKDNVSTIDYSGLDGSKYCLKTRNIVTRLDSNKINMELLIELLVYLHQQMWHDTNGAILVFMPGMSHIQELHDLIQSDSRFPKSEFLVIALHSALSSSDQSLAFKNARPGVCKIVIATNIAETGITIPDVVYVIDTGKVKETRYMESSAMSSLQEVYISQASAKQRAGRAGRVRPGFCYRLYTQEKYFKLSKYSVPEILRVPLEELCIQIMKCKLGSPADFLSQCLDPPLVQSIERAMSVLRTVGACRYDTVELTPLGHHLALLPVDVRIGKMLIFAAMFGCLELAAIIAASMTDKSPFVVPIGKRNDADAAKHMLAVANSDHLTLLNAFLRWKAAQSKGYAAEMQYCNRYFLKRANLLEIENVSNDLIKLIKSIGFDLFSANQLLKSGKKSKSKICDGVLNISETDIKTDALSPKMIAILKCVITAGLYPNVGLVSYTPPVDAVANPDKQICIAQTPQGPAAAHPASVNRLLGANGFLIFLEKVRLSRVYLRDSSLVDGLALLLFGGNITVQHNEQLLTLDDWITFKAPAKTGVIYKELRILIDDLLERKQAEPTLSFLEEPLVQLLLDVITYDAR